MSDREEVLGIIEKFFEIGKTKNLEVLKEIQEERHLLHLIIFEEDF